MAVWACRVCRLQAYVYDFGIGLLDIVACFSLAAACRTPKSRSRTAVEIAFNILSIDSSLRTGRET